MDYGLNLQGALGTIRTHIISISAGSLGTGANEYGINAPTGGSVVVGNGGTITLVGTGGGFYSNTASGNHGISFTGAMLSAGNNGSAASTINITGLGGGGLYALSGNFGVNVAGNLPVVFNNMATTNVLNFIHCTGGFVGSFNYGINLAGVVSVTGGGSTTNFFNISGGGNLSGTNNYGINVVAPFSAPAITLVDVTGGPGVGSALRRGTSDSMSAAAARSAAQRPTRSSPQQTALASAATRAVSRLIRAASSKSPTAERWFSSVTGGGVYSSGSLEITTASTSA